MTAGLLPGADRDLTAVVARRLGAVCEAILLETTVAGLAEEGDGVRVTLQGPGVEQAEHVFESGAGGGGPGPQLGDSWSRANRHPA